MTKPVPRLGFGAVAAPGQAGAQAAFYRVLARKYRPARFEDLIGQDAMVRTLSNAFDLERIHQAYILTGVRGVGKTTTARILARAFNYEVPARAGRPAVTRPTIHMPELGVHCQAIIESRHVDVIEMDAASHTGIDDVREIIESVRYLPVMARTKVYIIDEVHMLSKQAFNGLLKTLEEPPDHVKFVFATTEIEKVPVTVRSRCQRFDLRRVDAGVLAGYLSSICAKEAVAIEDEALSLIARAAEGSVRDALSLLDQAIAHGAGLPGAITAEALRTMLGLADRGRIIDLFEVLLRGQMAEALGILKELHDFGADPSEILAATRGIRSSRHPPKTRAGSRARCFADAGRADARPAVRARIVDAGLDACMAIAAERPARGERFAAPACRRRYGSGENRIRRRFAGPGRGFAQARRIDRRRGARRISPSRHGRRRRAGAKSRCEPRNRCRTRATPGMRLSRRSRSTGSRMWWRSPAAIATYK